MSTANDIAIAVTARLQDITTTNGYQTNIGLRVMRGRKRLEESHLPCAVIIERPDKADRQSGQRDPSVKVTQNFVIEGHAVCDADNPNDVGHQMVADIKRAIWHEKLTYGATQKVIAVNYEGKTLGPREDGISVASAAVEISVEFVESLASP